MRDQENSRRSGFLTEPSARVIQGFLFMPPPPHLDLSQVDLGRVLADHEAIRKVNPQRFEMEQLTAIVHADPAAHLIVGYKDVGTDEFWVRGHMPGYPLLPGVLMCEAAAQLCSYYISV